MDNERIDGLMRKHFGSFDMLDGRYHTKVESAEFFFEIAGKKLLVESRSSKGGNGLKALRIYNSFIEELTGYDAKERRKKLLKG